VRMVFRLRLEAAQIMVQRPTPQSWSQFDTIGIWQIFDCLGTLWANGLGDHDLVSSTFSLFTSNCICVVTGTPH
jgi:hypothetical protein